MTRLKFSFLLIVLASALLLSGASESPSPNPTPTPSTTTKKMETTGGGKNQNATTKDAPPKESLPIVNLSQAPNAGQISADTSDKKSNPPPTDWIAWFTGALVLVGIIQVVVFSVQARYMRKGLKLTKQAANAAEESAKVASRQTNIMATRERPWIMVKPDWPLPDAQNPFGGPESNGWQLTLVEVRRS